MTLERATPRASLIIFTGYLREAASATARSVFCPSQLESLFEDLDFHRLAAEQPFQLAHTLFKGADF